MSFPLCGEAWLVYSGYFSFLDIDFSSYIRFGSSVNDVVIRADSTSLTTLDFFVFHPCKELFIRIYGEITFE